jgi:hypothetical protein
MNRLLELVCILIVIILLSTFAASMKKEQFSNDIDTISNNIALSGLADLASSPSSAIRSFVKLVPNLDDLLNSSYLRSEYTNGLTGINTMSARTCSDNQGSLLANMNSNKNSCGMLIDLQSYSFKARTLKLQVVTNQTTPNTLVVSPSKDLIDFLLLRPAFFTLEDSKPYCLDLLRNTPFLFTTAGIPSVNVYKNFPTNKVSIPIKTPSTTSTNFFPNQTRTLTDILKIKLQNIRAITSRPTENVVEVNFTLYYVSRDEKNGNILTMNSNPNGSGTTAYFRDNSYMTSIINIVKSPADPLTTANVRNPVFTLCFSLFVQRTNDSTSPPWWLSEARPIVKVAGSGSATCDNNGRGLILAELRPQSLRTSNWTFKENGVSSGKYYCLDFTNVERNNTTNNVVDGCGTQNRLGIWLPTGLNIDIAFIISPTMKLAVGSYYDPEAKQKNITYVHQYHNSSTINDIYNTLLSTDNLCVDNMITKMNYDPSVFKLSNVELSYGMKNLHEWFYGV